MYSKILNIVGPKIFTIYQVYTSEPDNYLVSWATSYHIECIISEHFVKSVG